MRTSIIAASFLVLAAAPALAADYASLPPGQGRDVMVRVCSQCHSPEMAAGKRMDQPGWKGLVDQMANNGAQASDAEFDVIAKYLAASFPVTAAGSASPPAAPGGAAKTAGMQARALPSVTQRVVQKPGRLHGKAPSKPLPAALRPKTKGPGHS